VTLALPPAPSPVAAEPDSDTAVELSPGPLYCTPTVLFYGLAFLGGLAVATALLLQRPELLAVGAPSLVLLGRGLLVGRYPTVAVRAELDTPRALEGDLSRLSITLLSADEVGIVEVELGEMPGFEPVGSQRRVISLAARRPRTVTFVIVPLDWGVVDLPSFTVRARAGTGLFASALRYRCTTSLRVHINEEPARSQLEPMAFRRVVGSHLSADRSDGCEIADIRPYQEGDRLRSINWRISARHDAPWVTLRHPDRSTTVVLVLDAYGSFGDGEENTLRRTVRAAMGIARLHLDLQDPVGLLLLGHGRRWLEPQLGIGHLASLTDALLELSTQSWGDLRHRRQRLDLLLPVDSVVVAISPLLNEVFGQLLQPLLARAQQVHVIEPIYRMPERLVLPDEEDNGDPSAAWRIFSIEQQLRRRALTSLGASVSAWPVEEPLESMLVQLRRAQRARRATMRRPVR